MIKYIIEVHPIEVHQHLRNPAAADDEDEEDDNHIDDVEED